MIAYMTMSKIIARLIGPPKSEATPVISMLHSCKTPEIRMLGSSLLAEVVQLSQLFIKIPTLTGFLITETTPTMLPKLYIPLPIRSAILYLFLSLISLGVYNYCIFPTSVSLSVFSLLVGYILYRFNRNCHIEN
jgi:hypothetical protein